MITCTPAVSKSGDYKALTFVSPDTVWYNDVLILKYNVDAVPEVILE
jgi:hypothetical protein